MAKKESGGTQTLPAELPKVNLPAYMQSVPTTIPTLPTGAGTPFVWFSSRRSSDLWDKAKAAIPSLAEGQWVLFNSGDVELLDKLVYTIIAANVYYADMDDTGRTVMAHKTDGPGRTATVDVTAFIYHDDCAIPARITVRRAMVNAFSSVLADLAALQADSTAWAGRSKAHELAFKAMGTSTFAVVGEVTNIRKKPNKKGTEYFICDSKASPITSTQLSALKDFHAQDNANEQVERCLEASTKYLGSFPWGD